MPINKLRVGQAMMALGIGVIGVCVALTFYIRWSLQQHQCAQLNLPFDVKILIGNQCNIIYPKK